jgi:hypothetical protein
MSEQATSGIMPRIKRVLNYWFKNPNAEITTHTPRKPCLPFAQSNLFSCFDGFLSLPKQYLQAKIIHGGMGTYDT